MALQSSTVLIQQLSPFSLFSVLALKAQKISWDGDFTFISAMYQSILKKILRAAKITACGL